MKIAIIYNRESQAVINLFGVPNREKYGLETINKIKDAIRDGGHQVRAFEGDKNIIRKLEEFMPSVISGERPGLVFNLSYGIQGRARYTHIPSILEMLGIPYVGSGPETHAIALDKVVTKVILKQKGLPTPKFLVLDTPDAPITEELKYPLIVKPKDEAVSYGLKVVRNQEELRKGAQVIYEMFKGATLVEEYIEGREINVGLLGNDPVEALPPVELSFGEGEQIYTYEDKKNISGREITKVCPAPLTEEETKRIQDLAVAAFKAIGCSDSARVDFRLDEEGKPYILEINSMASLGPGSSYVHAAEKIGLDYTALANRLIEIASERYYGTAISTKIGSDDKENEVSVFSYLTKNRDRMENDLKAWTNTPSWTDDAVGLSNVIRKLGDRFNKLGLKPVIEYTNSRSAWTWQTRGGIKDGTLLVVPVDVPGDRGGYPVPFRRDPEWLYGEGVASSRAGIAIALQALAALRTVKKLKDTKLGILVYSDEGRGMRYSSQLFSKVAEQANQVIVLQPGFKQGKVVDQRRGSRKFSVIVEGRSQRIGAKSSVDGLTWFLRKYKNLESLSDVEQKLSVAVQDVHSERYSMLLPHRVKATIYLTYINEELADKMEKKIREVLTSDVKGITAYTEKLEERPPLVRSESNGVVIDKLKEISGEWQLPFGVEGGLLPSAAGVVPEGTAVVCGFGPASRQLYTPNESIHRGELLQRVLLLTLFLLEG
ncbi:D-alanine-D-alanine ligase [Desulfitispora alkaliphila]|uniref:M20/M25/M40 family metallo-hydrolase n=1 Tax=Desulfitispora alkaliphila TaxID=622674 RepID=UPI003D1ED514